MNCQKALELVWCIQNLRDVREIDPGSNPEKVERRIVAPDGGTARYDSGGRAADYSAGISPGGGGVPDAVWTFTGRAVATGSLAAGTISRTSSRGFELSTPQSRLASVT